MYYRCTNCKWEGEDAPLSEWVPQHLCPVCGDNAYIIREEKKEEVAKPKKKEFDLNMDGKVDKKDRSLAAKVLGSIKKKRGRKGKK